MTISYNWLCELLPETLSVTEVSEILTAVGLEVDGLEEVSTVKGGLKGLVIGKILTAEPLPNSDKLQITTVDVGQEIPLQIVCGAPNAAAGQTVVVATPGTTIYPTVGEPFTIKNAKIRGTESFGMICAEDEIGLGTDHGGIIVLEKEITPGTLAADYYNIPKADYAIEIGLTPNRMDAMSHMGCAKDICAYLANRNNTNVTQIVPTSKIIEATTNTIDIKINIIDTEKCKRYMGIALSNVQVGESPEWMQAKLKTIGVRSINNVVDITNYILHECGQPLHAFDADTIIGNEINVKCLPANTVFTTLDAIDRKLQETDLMICNASEPMCMAGVFGGNKSGVTVATKNIFLESAWFAPNNTRLTSMHHGLRTDSAIRFEKGVDISQTEYALRRAAQLIVEHCGATIASNIQDVYPEKLVENKIEITYEYINRLSGNNYSKEKVKNILLHLCFGILNETEDGLTLQVPYAKPDVTIPADIVEELMRIDGLDNVPFTGKIQFALRSTPPNTSAICKEKVAATLVAKGYYELFTNSITNGAYFPDHKTLVPMLNSLSSELNVLRPQMLETGLQAISHNVNRKNTDLLFFEFGKTYNNYNGKYTEQEQLSLYITGNKNAEHWQEKSSKTDLYFAKGIATALYNSLAIEVSFNTTENGLQILNKKTVLGTIQNVSEATLKQFDIKQEVWYINCNWKSIVDLVEKQKIIFKEIPKFPGMRRDLALVIGKEVTYTQIVKAVNQTNSTLLQNVNIFDVFENEKLGADKKSYAISLEFADATKTLTDADVLADVNKIIESLDNNCGAVIRS
jgi:phenylalanyl-tRNA synthetase beta chain